MDDALIVVDGFVATYAKDTDLRRDVWAYALDQRAFGPGRLLVIFSDRSGRLVSVAHARCADPPEAVLEACIQHLGRGAEAAVALCDERVDEGPRPPDSVVARFARARSKAEGYGVHLVDWISCDDTLTRSMRLAIDPQGEWWDVPPAPSGRPRPRQVARRGPAGETRWVPRNSVKRRR